MKTLMILVFQFLPGDTLNVCEDTWGNSLNNCYSHYFNTKIENRGNYLLNQFQIQKKLPASYVSNVLNDLASLSGMKFTFEYEIGSFSGDFIIKDYPKFENEILLFKQKSKELNYKSNNSDIVNYQIKTKNFDNYFKLSPCDRVLYFKSNYRKLPLDIKTIIQKDIETIFEIKKSKSDFSKKQIIELYNSYKKSKCT